MRGGKRAGAGRKKGFAAKNAEEARKYFSERVAHEIEPLCDTLLNRAKTGDIRAIHELFVRAWGRSVQSVSVEKYQPVLIVDDIEKSLEKIYGDSADLSEKEAMK